MDFPSWINGLSVGLASGLLLGLVVLLNKIVKYRKAYKFVRHIENHLNENESIICKICDKTIDDIYEEKE